MKPFGQLIAERSKDPERCVNECAKFVKRYAGKSGTTRIDLEEVAWLGAIVYLGMEESLKASMQEPSKSEVVNNGSRIVSVVTQSGSDVKDAVA